jgi:glucose/arabinose dehydrogenase
MAQDVTRPNGKIHRLNTDGSVPKDNPFLEITDAYPSIFSFGNRNPQGLVYYGGVLWETEHGPKGGDELNIIKPGANYGWPVISYGRNYNGTELTPYTHREGMEQPISQWTPSIAASGLNVYSGTEFPAWNGYLLAGSLKFEELRLIETKGGVHKDERVLLKDQGRIRDITIGSDGAIYVVVNTPGKVLRLTRADKD